MLLLPRPWSWNNPRTLANLHSRLKGINHTHLKFQRCRQMTTTLLHSTPANVPVAEEELAAEVALLNGVIVGERDEAGVVGGHAHHGEVLDELAAQRAGAHQEGAQLLQLLLHRPAEHCDLPIVAAPLQCQL